MCLFDFDMSVIEGAGSAPVTEPIVCQAVCRHAQRRNGCPVAEWHRHHALAGSIGNHTASDCLTVAAEHSHAVAGVQTALPGIGRMNPQLRFALSLQMASAMRVTGIQEMKRLPGN